MERDAVVARRSAAVAKAAQEIPLARMTTSRAAQVAAHHRASGCKHNVGEGKHRSVRSMACSRARCTSLAAAIRERRVSGQGEARQAHFVTCALQG